MGGAEGTVIADKVAAINAGTSFISVDCQKAVPRTS
jgi:hypothetical protein